MKTLTTRLAPSPTIICAIFAMLVSGCGTVPSAVNMPKPLTKDGLPTTSRYAVTIDDEPYDESKYGDRLPLETTPENVRDQLDAHRRAWSGQASALRRAVDRWGNTSFSGIVAAGLGAATNISELTIGGTAVAGGSGIWQDRFKLAVQASNYRVAANVIVCFEQEFDKVRPSTWEAVYNPDDGSMRIAKEDLQAAVPAGTDLAVPYGELKGIWSHINREIFEARQKLRSVQEALVLGTPSAESITAALKQLQKKEQEAPAEAQKFMASAQILADKGAALANDAKARLATAQGGGQVNTDLLKDAQGRPGSDKVAQAVVFASRMQKQYAAVISSAALPGHQSLSSSDELRAKIESLNTLQAAYSAMATQTNPDFETLLKLPAAITACRAKSPT